MSNRTHSYFLSDLHLGAKYSTDPHAAEKHVVEFLESIRHNAKNLFLLGDILDYWYEYRHVVPKGFIRFFGKLAQLSDEGVTIKWFIGNHDIWIFDYLPSELGIEVIDGYSIEKINGHKFFLSHGDGIGYQKPLFKTTRTIFRNRICQLLFAAIHPRWTIPFALRCSKSSRSSHCNDSSLDGDASSNYYVSDASTEPLMKFSIDYLKNNPSIEYFIFGHRHILIRASVSDNCEMIILGDWLTKFSYAVFDGKSLELMQYYNNQY